MSRLEIILSAVLTFSIILNIGFFLYARASVLRLLAVAEELGDLQRMMDAFARHLKAVYELDSFYGDQTLESLLNHAISLNEQMETFEFIYSLIEETDKIDDAENPPENEETAPEAK
tara:strand:+ start:22625 stop:22975 length:351 start_codon:yes stop_codon:yes gene_type:complete